MNDKQKQLYSYFKDNGLTDLDSNKFFSAYSDPSKSKELYAYLKQNGLTDLDANAFHVAYFSPVKKKSTTGSPSVQKKKPTSSATMPSWMQSSLEQSSKKEQPKKPTGPQVVKSSQQESSTAGLTKEDVQNIANMGVNPMGSAMGNVQPKKQEERDFDIYYGYPGQEKNEYRISNGRWQRKYGDKWVEVSNQGSINALTKFFGKEKEILKEEVFTGFPGKEENKYRVSELQNGQKVWEVQRAGQKEYTVIGDQGSIDALNRQFNKKVEYTENAQLKREAEINRRESASEDFKTITGKLVGKESDEVAAYLRKMYGDRGFRFVPTGFLTDNIEVISEATGKRETFVLDNFRDETDSAEALKLRKFLSENQQLGDYIDLEREEKKNAEEAIVGTRLTQEDLNRQMGRLQGAGSQAQFELAKKQNTEENIIKDLSKQSTEVVEARKTLIRADYDTKQRIDDLTRTAKTDAEMQEVAAIAVANKDEFVKKSGIDNAYLNDLNKSSKSLDQSFKTLNSDVENFNRYIKDNNITQEQLENDPELLAKKDELQVRYDQLIADAEDLDFENKKIPFIQNQNARNAALYFAYNETRGSVIGGVWNGLLRGALSSLQTFRAVDKEGLDNLVETFGSYTTKEFAQSENRNDFSKALLSTSESLGAAAAAVLTGGLATEGTVASKVLGFIPYFSVSYNEIKNEIDQIPGMDKAPWYKKEALAIAYGLGVGYLDKLSTDFQIKGKISNKIGRDLVLRSIAGLPKGATAEAIQMAIASNFKKDIAAGALKIVAGSVVEGVTEGVQSAYGTGLKEVYDWMNGVDEFDSREWVSQAFEEAYYGALGGAIMSTPSTLINGAKNGFARLDPKDMELARKVIEDSNMRSMVITDIKAKLMSGEITKEEANAQMEAIKSSQELFGKIPDNLSAEDTSKSMDLIKERSKIEKEISGKDESLVAPQKARIAEINKELTKISEDATKKSTEQEVTAEGGGVQREGIVEGQPEVGQGEGTVGQATTNEADLGNRPVEGRGVQEEEVTVTPVEEAPVKEMPKAVETTDTKSYSDALAEAKRQMKEDGSGLDLQVSDVSKEEADAILADGGKIFMTEDGMAGAYVKKDGYMGGLFKNPRAKISEVGKVLQQARVEVGGKFMDAYATKLEDIYIKNGFRPVARIKFNEEYAPEGWNAEGSPLAGKPDVVFFSYDPEGKYKKGDGQYLEDYDAAYEMAKNFDAKAVNEADKLAAIIDKKAAVSKDIISKEEVSKRVNIAQKALSVVLPDVKFVVHDTDEAYRKAVGEMNKKEQSSSGAYDMVSKTIHVNSTKANKRTVSHEVFHAIIISKAASDKQLQKLTSNMVNAVIKSLKQTGTNQEVINYLNDFASNYESNLQNEEKLAELHGILGENMIELPMPTQNIIKRFLDRLAKMFGLKEMTDSEAVEFMNTMSSKVETGKEITDKEFKASKGTIKDAVNRFQANFKDEVSGLEFVYDENGEKFADLEKNGFITKDKSITNFDGQYMFFHQPDAAFSGMIVKRNKKTGEVELLIEGKGGMYYPIKFHENGYFWASTNSVAEKMAKDLNEAMEQNGGKLLMALTSAPYDKLLSSTTAANSVMELISSKAFDRNFAINPAQLKNILINAAAFTKEQKTIIKDKNKKPILDKNGNVQYRIKNVGLGIKIKKGDSLEDVKSKIKELLDPDAKSFADRKTFVEAMIKETVDIINSNPKAISQFGEFFSSGIQNKYFKGTRKKGYNISAANMKQALSEMLTEPMLKEGVNREKGGQIYAIIELDGKVKPVDSDLHESYPKAIQSVDPKNNKVKLHILTDRVKWNEVAEDFETNDIVAPGDRELEIFPTSGISVRALRVNTKNISKKEEESTQKAQIEEEVKTLEDEIKFIRKQKPVGDNKKENYGKPKDFDNSIFLHETFPQNIESIKKNGFKESENYRITNGIYTIPLKWKQFDSPNLSKIFIKIKDGAKIFWTGSERPSDFYYGQGNYFYQNLYNDLTKNNDPRQNEPIYESKEHKDFLNKFKNWLLENGYAGVQQGGEIVIIDFSKIEIIEDAESDKLNENFRKQKASKQAEMIVKKGKEANLSDAGIREYMKRNGYTDRQAIDAIQAYNDKKEGIFIDPEWSKLRKAAVLFNRKFFVSRGLLANTVFASNEKRLAIVAKQLNKAQNLITDFDRALDVIRKESIAQYKRDVREYINGDPTVNLPAEIKAQIDSKTGIKDRIKLMLAIRKLADQNVENKRADFDAYIRDKSAVLPLELKKVADSMRAHIDSISRELISNGLIEENLAEKVIDNLGSYLNRSYKIYDRKNWKKEIEKEVKDKAINFLKIQLRPIAEEQAKKDNRDVDDVLDDLAKIRVERYFSEQEEDMALFASGGKLGSKNLSVLKAREEIPVEIRMLMGEYTDPGQNYARTILKMSGLAANHQFLNEVKKAGTGVFLFEKDDSKTPKGYNYKIAAEGSVTMNPLNGMYTSKELKEEFEKQSSQLSKFWSFYMNILSRVKWGKTIMSPATHLKNLIGNIGFVLVNGHWRIGEMSTAYKAVRDDLLSLDKKDSREYVNKLIELGIIKQSAGMGEIRAMFADASWEESMLSNINKKSGSRWGKIKSGWNKFTKGAEDVYQAEDDFYKIFAYENELSRYSKAMFGKSKKELTESERAEVDTVVAEIVKNTYPTYSRIPEAVNMIRRAPLIGNFVSFQAESYRTAYMTAKLAMEEIKSDNPNIRQIGAQRIAGALTYKSIKTAILAYYSYAAGMGAVGLLGYFTDDEEEKQKEDDVRKFLPEWSTNSDLVVKKAGDGKIVYIDMSASDPHGGINKVLNSIMLGETTFDAFINGLGSIVEPFVGEEMTTAALLSLKNNENAYGKPIYNPEDNFYEQSKDITGFMFNVVQPGIVASGRRVAKAENVLEEVTGAVTGARTYNIDVAENFGYTMMRYQDRLLNANRIYTSEVYNKDATEKSIAAAKKRAEKAVTDIHSEIYDLYYSAVRLGADEDKLYDNLKSFGGMTKRSINYMFGQEEFYIKDKYPEEEE